MIATIHPLLPDCNRDGVQGPMPVVGCAPQPDWASFLPAAARRPEMGSKSVDIKQAPEMWSSPPFFCLADSSRCAHTVYRSPTCHVRSIA